eukprot:4191854-Pleurochrysis_carterae.AAC.1
MSASLVSKRLSRSSSASILDSPHASRSTAVVAGRSAKVESASAAFISAGAVGCHADDGVVRARRVMATEALAKSWRELRQQ